MLRFIAPLALALVLLLLGACSAPVERRLDLIVTAEGYATPQIEATAGEQLFIRFKNDDSVAHSLTVDLPSGSRTVSAEAGVDAILALSPQEPGTFRFYCRVPGHTEQGELVVTAP
jgi:plastocyanin